MKRIREIVRDDPIWIDGDFYLHVYSSPIIIEAGSWQRAVPCVICNVPAGKRECFLLCLVAGLVCPADGSHLGGLGTFCHVPCLPRSDAVLIAAVRRLLQHKHE